MSSLSSGSSSLSSSSSPVVCGITLKRQAMSKYVEGRTQGYRLKVECTDAQCTDENLFVYRRSCCDPTSNECVLEFVSVASPADIEEYPVYIPGVDLGDAVFCRWDQLDLVFRSTIDLEDTWAAIVSDVSELSSTLRLMEENNLGDEEILEITGFRPRDYDRLRFRSGIFKGTGTNQYTIQFVPPFTRAPVLAVMTTKMVNWQLDGDPTAQQAKVKFSTALEASDKIHWIATGY